MIRTWLHPEIFLGAPKTALDLPVVKEYVTGKPVDARKIVWVSGSDVAGPMGPVPVPVSEGAALDDFRKRHGGTTVFRLEELDDDQWQEITGRHAAPSK